MKKRKRKQPESNTDIHGTVTEYLLFLKQNWDPEQFRKQRRFFDKCYSGSEYIGESENDTQRGSCAGSDREQIGILEDYPQEYPKRRNKKIR